MATAPAGDVRVYEVNGRKPEPDTDPVAVQSLLDHWER